MAKQLIAEMSGKWDPEDFKDEFKHQVMKLVDKKVKAGKTETVIEPEEEVPESSNVIDLTELLQRSLKGGAKANGKTASKSAAKTAPAKKAKPRRAAAKKTTAERKAA
jgi:DNA end-binding protein Ku